MTIDWINKGKSSAVFRQQIIHTDSGIRVADATVIWLTAGTNGKPVPIPEELIEAYRRSFDSVPS